MDVISCLFFFTLNSQLFKISISSLNTLLTVCNGTSYFLHCWQWNSSTGNLIIVP
jgi:hypothetical protein